MGLASGRFRLGDHAGAADALGNALRHYSPAVGFDALAGAVVEAAGLPGWCGLLGSGVPVVQSAAGAKVDVRLDGRPVLRKLSPKTWAGARWMTVTAMGRHLLGSPIDVAAIARVSGCTELWDGGMRGWACHPNDPETNSILTIYDALDRPVRRIVASDENVEIAHNNPTFRPRGFRVPAAWLTGVPGPFRVVGRDGRDLLGSPLDSSLVERIVTNQPGVASKGPRPVAVVIPMHNQASAALACLASILASGCGDSPVIVIDDGSREMELTEALDRLARAKRIRLLRHERPQGFPASANAGIAACPEYDVAVLNSDTLVPPGWLGRLTNAAYRAPDIGTVTPLSNNAGFLTYPTPNEAGIMPDIVTTMQLDRLARRANGHDPIEIPVGLGFCLYIKRTCLDAVGALRADIFAQGYGAADDFCLHAVSLGWRHVALPGLYVAHGGGARFGSADRYLRLRNEAILNRLHPSYPDLIRSFSIADPLAEARRRLDLTRWRAARPTVRRSVILITHAAGGGVEQRVSEAAAGYRADGLAAVVLRPGLLRDGRHAVVVGDGPEGGYPNLRYTFPDGMRALLNLLRGTHPEWIEVHHVLGHPPAIYDAVRRLGVPYDAYIHDYAWICPRISLMGSDDRYCGEPDLAGCEACIARNGHLIGEDIGVAALRRRSARFLAAARRLIAPSQDAATRMRRYFPTLPISVRPHSNDMALPAPTGLRGTGGTVRVCVVGGIGPHKGFDVLLACALDAAKRSLRLEFVVVGDTTGDAALLDTGRVFITGTFKPHEAVALIRQQNAILGFVPSVWPETWSLTLTELWQAGLDVAAFDLGAPAERIRATGRGFLLPFGLPAAAINDALLAAAGQFGHEERPSSYRGSLFHDS